MLNKISFTAVLMALLLPFTAVAVTPIGPIGAAFEACGTTVSRQEQQNTLKVLYGNGQASLIVGGLHDMASGVSFVNYQVPTGKKLRIFCLSLYSFAAQPMELKVGYGDDATAASDSADPTNAVYFTGNATFFIFGTDSTINRFDIIIDAVVPAGKFPFHRLDNGPSDSGALYVYGILEDE